MFRVTCLFNGRYSIVTSYAWRRRDFGIRQSSVPLRVPAGTAHFTSTTEILTSFSVSLRSNAPPSAMITRTSYFLRDRPQITCDFRQAALRSRYGSMILKGLVPLMGNWFICSIIRASSSALPSTRTACATVARLLVRMATRASYGQVMETSASSDRVFAYTRITPFFTRSICCSPTSGSDTFMMKS